MLFHVFSYTCTYTYAGRIITAPALEHASGEGEDCGEPRTGWGSPHGPPEGNRRPRRTLGGTLPTGGSLLGFGSGTKSNNCLGNPAWKLSVLQAMAERAHTTSTMAATATTLGHSAGALGLAGSGNRKRSYKGRALNTGKGSSCIRADIA